MTITTDSFVEPNPLRLPQRTSWNHWQLRDVIHCPFPENQIYSIYKQNIEKYDVTTRMSQKVIKNLPFDPVSLSINKEYIAAGGQRGELAIANQNNTSDIKIIKLSDSINNFMCFELAQPVYDNGGYSSPYRDSDDIGVNIVDDNKGSNSNSSSSSSSSSISRRSSITESGSGYNFDNTGSIFGCGDGSVVEKYDDLRGIRNRLLVCNNDKSIKIVSLPSLSVDHEIYFDTSINNASISPDRSKMVAVGDTNEAFLFNKRGSDYEKIATLTGSSDACFSSDWNRGSNIFAIASQDGHVNIWDVRMNKKLASMESVQSGRACGACRNVKFSRNGSIDLMAFSEHASYVTIVDARTFNEKQLLKTSTELGDSQITGIEFSYNSDKLFVGLEGCILDYKIDTLRRRCFPSYQII